MNLNPVETDGEGLEREAPFMKLSRESCEGARRRRDSNQRLGAP